MVLVARSGAAMVAVGIAGREDREPARPLQRLGRAIAHGLARFRLADREDAGLGRDHRAHRVLDPGHRRDAIERDARTDEVEAIVLAEEHPRRIGE